MVDIAPIAEIVLATGTLALAGLGYLTIRENRKQLSLLSLRTGIERAQLEPYLLVKTLNFEGNQLKLRIENKGNGHATWLGIQATFYPVERRSYADQSTSVPINQAQVIDRQSRGLVAWEHFEPSQRLL